MKTALDRNELQAAIELIEEDGPLSNLGLLYSHLADMLDIDISPATIKKHIEKWKIPTQTKKKLCKQTREPESKICHTQMITILVPSGKCPYKLVDTKFESVEDWVKKVRHFGIERGLDYTTTAIVYFARYQYDIFSPEYQKVRQHIEAIMS